jgi:2-iminobutanoate/2-iminopropanoate deaminase
MTSTQKENRKLWIIFLIALLIALLPWILLAQDIKKQKFNISKQGEDEIGYAQAVRVGNTLYISGSVGGGQMAKAVMDVYDELENTLKAYGADFRNVVKENVFTTDLDGFKSQIPLRKEFYQGDFPAASWVQVDRLYLPEFTLEIELIAELPDK